MRSKQKRVPSAKVLRRLIAYNPETGELRWKERPAWMFSDSGAGGRDGSCARWNGRYAGKLAFTATQSQRSYKVGRIFDQLFLAHRIAFAIHHGRWPNDVIDHINGVQGDNRSLNLRDVSQSENVRSGTRHNKQNGERMSHAI